MFWKKKDKSKQPAAVELPPATGALELYVVIRTDLGNVRTNNEDAASYVRMADDAIRQTRGFLLIVADGMGGHNAGEVASKIAIDTISQEYFKGSNGNNFEKALGKAFNTANKKILELASAHEAYKGMGTTCTAVVVTATAIYFAHAGDSRAYLYKNKSLSRVTEDHTYVKQLVNNGDITAEEADGHPQ